MSCKTRLEKAKNDKSSISANYEEEQRGTVQKEPKNETIRSVLSEPEENDYLGHRKPGTNKRTMFVNLKVDNKGAENLNYTDNDDLRRKSPAQRQLNSVQRQKQIAEYNMLKLKEERRKRYRVRHGDDPFYRYAQDDSYVVDPSSGTCDDDNMASPKRRKRVSFEF